MTFNIWKYHTKKQIKQIFLQLNKDLYVNNSYFFHYNQFELKKYLKYKNADMKQRFQSFYSYWHNFSNKKHIIDKFLKNNTILYPTLFYKNKRQIIKKFKIDYKIILNQINSYNAIKKDIPYSYSILIKKLIKTILINQAFKNKKIEIIDININENLIYIIQLKETKNIQHKYRLNKFLQKYQSLYPNKYKFCNAILVVSSYWQDLLLQSTFKQWTSCMNLINNTSDYIINYSSTNGIKAGNLIAYCILDLGDKKTIDQIMNDNGYHGLMYQRCFWRCSIKRYVNIENINDYLFCAENTSYGTILQNAITYHYNLFVILNKWLYQLNQELKKKYSYNKSYSIYKLPYNIYSDLHTYCNQSTDNKLYYFNINYIKTNINEISMKELKKIKKLLWKNKFLLTSDIVALLNVFKFFQDNQKAKFYLKKYENSKQDYVLKKYFPNKSHFFIKNIRDANRTLNKCSKINDFFINNIK